MGVAGTLDVALENDAEQRLRTRALYGSGNIEANVILATGPDGHDNRLVLRHVGRPSLENPLAAQAVKGLVPGVGSA